MRPVEEREKDKSIAFMSFLFENYNPECWWMETVDMYRRIFMTGGLVLFWRGSAEQILAGIVVSIVSLRILARYKPFRVASTGGKINVDNNHLAESMQWQLVGTLVCCLLLRFIEVGGTAGAEVVFGEKVLDVMLLVMQFVAFVFMGGRLVKGLLWPKAGSDVVVPVLEEGGEEDEGEGILDAVETRMLLLRHRLREKEDIVREKDERLRVMGRDVVDRDERLRDRDERLRDMGRDARDRDVRLRDMSANLQAEREEKERVLRLLAEREKDR